MPESALAVARAQATLRTAAQDHLVMLEKAAQMLAAARTVEDFQHVRNAAEAARTWARLAKLGRAAQTDAAIIRVRAERAAAELALELIGERGRDGRPPKNRTRATVFTIEELGLTRQDLARWRPLVQLPIPEMERHFVQVIEQGGDVTTVGVARAALDYARSVEGGRMVADVVAPLPSNHRVFEGDCREILAELPSASVHCVVTSVPYWRQRDYGHPAQIGVEPTPEQWVEDLAGVFKEVHRVADGRASLWLNVGDKWQGSGYGWGVVSRHSGESGRDEWHERSILGLAKPTRGYKRLDLTLAPKLLADRLRQDGWYLRQTIIWDKGVAIEPKRPNRPSTSHEYVFLFTASEDSRVEDPGEDWWTESVWHIKAEPSDEHPARMPDELVRRCLIASTRTGDDVLDPFAGVMTTARVARSIGRSSTSIELVHDFVERGRAHLLEAPEPMQEVLS